MSYLPESVIFAIAFLARMIPAIIHGSLTGNYGYDASVYYAAGDAFIHGRMPYRDFVMLHPPGIMLMDAPFAALGSTTSDTLGFAAASVVFALLAALSAVLVTRVARRLGLPRRAALVGGVVYALWVGAIAAEYLARLEPLGCLFMLCGLLAMLNSKERSAAGEKRRATVLALVSGLAFGAAVSVKIWWVAPILVILVWQLVVDRAPGRALRMLAGAVVTGLIVDLPFLLIARGTMFRMVVLDQLGRPVDNHTPLRPFAYMLLGKLGQHETHAAMLVASLCGAVLVLVLAVRAWRYPAARLLVVVLVAQLIQIAYDPSWFDFYADFITVSLSLVAAAGVAPRPVSVTDDVSDKNEHRIGWWAPGLAGAMAIGLIWLMPSGLIQKFPGATLGAAAKPYHCVMSDSPMALIDMNVLSRDFHNGCPNLVDVTGLQFDLERGLKRSQYKQENVTWNADIVKYLRSGDALVLLRTPKQLSLTRKTMRTLHTNRRVISVDGVDLYKVHNGVTQNEG